MFPNYGIFCKTEIKQVGRLNFISEIAKKGKLKEMKIYIFELFPNMKITSKRNWRKIGLFRC